jgi:hypothetical protein
VGGVGASIASTGGLTLFRIEDTFAREGFPVDRGTLSRWKKRVGDCLGAGLKNKTCFRDQVIAPLLDAGLLEMTIPDKPRSSKQRYRTTEAGRALLVNCKSWAT